MDLPSAHFRPLLNREAMIFAVMNAVFCNCVEKSEKFRSSMGFEPVISRRWCGALTNSTMKILILGAGHL